jgi:hypothetical protein
MTKICLINGSLGIHFRNDYLGVQIDYQKLKELLDSGNPYSSESLTIEPKQKHWVITITEGKDELVAVLPFDRMSDLLEFGDYIIGD